ncbi:hypothetical protein FQN54_006115 [Arachnomyces sp. PD_36]|nr:hypothetical protein FQN54_006115 [Arachnomyces sp. PD_36]
MESTNCFTHLTDNLPSWIVRVTDLAAHTTAKHAEFSADYSKLSSVKPRRRKNSSIHSIRPDDTQSAGKKDTSSDKTNASTSSQKDQPYENPNKYIQAANRRRRGGVDGGSARSGDNPRSTTRARHMVVVHYDAHTQNELDQLVKDIGAARNNLRKTRMARMRSNYGGFGMRLPLINTRNGFRKPPSPVLDDGTPAPAEREPPFDLTDKQLELAQSFCEVAAHQFLRDGDCSSQLDSTRERLESVLETAKVEAELLAEEEKAKKERGELEDDSAAKKAETEQVKPEDPAKSPPTGITAIEVDDDSSASSISIDITAFRSTRLRV